ncbi:unnamed protein product [Didymodactylos carnosus]|nr:unnamed protein product [Didymodactylos carnosus]CAF3662376.1 unnamed protein product [Didymodactylos carnosus]
MIKSFNLLSVKEKESVLSKLLTVLSDDAYCFVYEKEWIKDNENHSSTPIDLINYFHSSTSKHSDNKTNYGFALVSVRPLQTYVQLKSEPFHLCFLFKKVHYIDAPETLRDFLDQQQYSKNSVLRYEKIFGPGFVSTGGLDTTKEFVATLDLKPEHRVLDIGAGIGGGDIFIAKTYGCSVIGVDLSTNMVGIAWERLLGLTDAKIKVSFEIGDVMKLEYDNNSFDVVYSRDCILHIQDKHELFTRIYNWLKPGGKLFITDYCCGKKPWSKDYEAYVNDRRYNLLTVQEYGKYLEDVGFKQVEPVDGTNRFADCLKVELERINSMKNEFISEFSDEDYKHLVDGWESKLARTSEGHQRWGIFRATK